jgi:cobalamin synthase
MKRMAISRSTIAAVLAVMLVTGVATLAYAQAPISGLAAQAASRVQAEAEVVSRILANRPAYTGTGERVGRVVTVTVASDRTSIIAIVALRPGFGRGQIAVPASNLRQVRGRVIIPGTPDAIRLMPRVQGS